MPITYISDGPRRTALYHAPLPEIWAAFENRGVRYSSDSAKRRGFRRFILQFIIPEDHQYISPHLVFCRGCSRPTLMNNSYDSAPQGRICRPCAVDTYAHCGTCSRYYHPERDRNHTTKHVSCCGSGAERFSIRNGDNGALSNDTPTEVSLPSGTISEEGLQAIMSLVYAQSYDATTTGEAGSWRVLSRSLEELGTTWQTRKGNYAKRLSNMAYKKHALKVPPTVMSQIGNIASDHSQPVGFTIEATRKLNNTATYFAHSGSCWWSSYSASRCILKTNGGLALRTLEHGRPTGRAWVMPLKNMGTVTAPRLVPTYETLEPAGYVVFNGYGALGGYAAARVLAHMAGMTYRKVRFTCEGMYVNGESGYVVAHEELANHYTDGRLYIDDAPRHSRLLREERAAQTIRVKKNSNERENAHA